MALTKASDMSAPDWLSQTYVKHGVKWPVFPNGGNPYKELQFMYNIFL